MTGVLTFLDLESPLLSSSSSLPGPGDALDISLMGNNNSRELSKFERKDVWAMKWASDNPELLAIMEKTRMYILRGLEPEEPIVSSGYICSFQVKQEKHCRLYKTDPEKEYTYNKQQKDDKILASKARNIFRIWECYMRWQLLFCAEHISEVEIVLHLCTFSSHRW
jgi:hypothetical protein